MTHRFALPAAAAALAAVALTAGPKAGDYVDSFTGPQAPHRRLERGDWKVANGVAEVTQNDELYRKYKNHGPIAFYDMDLQDSRVAFEVRFDGAERFVFTLNGKPGHVIRFMQDKNGGAMLAYKQGDGKMVAERIDTSLPALRQGEWTRVEVVNRGDRATVRIGDSFEKTVRHATYSRPKANLSLSFHFGTMSVRSLSVEKL